MVSGASQKLAPRRSAELEDERDRRPADPAAKWSGRWWSAPRPARNPRPPRPRRGPWPVAPIRTATNTRPGRSRSQHIQMPSPSPAQGLTLQGHRCHSRIGQITRPPPEAARLQGDTAISAGGLGGCSRGREQSERTRQDPSPRRPPRRHDDQRRAQRVPAGIKLSPPARLPGCRWRGRQGAGDLPQQRGDQRRITGSAAVTGSSRRGRSCGPTRSSAACAEVGSAL